ncbi:hypothetical protein, partial [Aquamicrobium defluvii]|uniref:hypothetical protein n=1 Tax=Aquamicrobium defluvii TaxID=69279 RepID=UPI001AADD59F
RNTVRQAGNKLRRSNLHCRNHHMVDQLSLDPRAFCSQMETFGVAQMQYKQIVRSFHRFGETMK